MSVDEVCPCCEADVEFESDSATCGSCRVPLTLEEEGDLRGEDWHRVAYVHVSVKDLRAREINAGIAEDTKDVHAMVAGASAPLCGRYDCKEDPATRFNPKSSWNCPRCAEVLRGAL